MEDKTFAQALDALNQRALADITNEAMCCWGAMQRGATVAEATAHIESEQMRDALKHFLFYLLLQSLLFEVKHRQLISSERYEELKCYIDTLSNQVKQQPFVVLPLTTT